VNTELDVHESVHRDTIMKVTNNMQLYRLIYYSWSVLHVSGDGFAHHQEHLTVFTVSGSIHPSCCRLVFWLSWNCFAVSAQPRHQGWERLNSEYWTWRIWISASWYNYESNQQDATIQVNLLFLVSSTCFGRCFRPSSGAFDCIYSIW